VGWDRKCYWGLFGVQWVKPLPVYQEKKGAGVKTPVKAPVKAPVKTPVKTTVKTPWPTKNIRLVWQKTVPGAYMTKKWKGWVMSIHASKMDKRDKDS
jgi:hypothetical protein